MRAAQLPRESRKSASAEIVKKPRRFPGSVPITPIEDVPPGGSDATHTLSRTALSNENMMLNEGGDSIKKRQDTGPDVGAGWPRVNENAGRFWRHGGSRRIHN